MISQQVINGFMLGSVYALVAVAFTFTIGVLNFLNFSLPGLFMVAGMFTWFLLISMVLLITLVCLVAKDQFSSALLPIFIFESDTLTMKRICAVG